MMSAQDVVLILAQSALDCVVAAGLSTSDPAVTYYCRPSLGDGPTSAGVDNAECPAQATKIISWLLKEHCFP